MKEATDGDDDPERSQLRRAHDGLDRAVDVLFDAEKPFRTDVDRLGVLFGRYAAWTNPAGRA